MTASCNLDDYLATGVSHALATCKRGRRHVARRLLASIVFLTPLAGILTPLAGFLSPLAGFLSPLAGFLSPLAMSTARADFPETIERAGRLCGCGWGDGYHACHSSGVRPLANLPPRTFVARVATAPERFAGCPTCGPRAFPGTGPITSPSGPETFYDRFDQYAAQVSHREASAAANHAAANRPRQPVIDPERDAPRYASPREPGLQSSMSRSGYANSTLESEKKNTNDITTVHGQPAAPALSVEELEEFRQYQAEKRERQKIEKYLIEPDEIEPSQIFGDPPVGTEERRRRDEAKLDALQRDIRQQREQSASPSRQSLDAGEDRLASPSDEDLPLPMDELLPPFPRDEELRDDQRRRDKRVRQPADAPPIQSPPTRRPGSEAIPPGRSERRNDLDARIAETPDWQFVKQPR